MIPFPISISARTMETLSCHAKDRRLRSDFECSDLPK
jgi:hypothetical protein